MMYFKLAWRNMWRSRRRTLITISSIFFAVLFAVLMRVMVVGIFDKMITDTVSMSCGYLQVHQQGFWTSRSIDSTMQADPKLNSLLDADKQVSAWTPRVESFALASSGDKTRGILVMGIDPARENKVSSLKKKITSGTYLGDNENCVMLAEGLATYLKLKVNDTVILLGQGYQGNMASGRYTVKAIVSLGTPEMNKALVWMPMQQAWNFLSTGERYTSISLLMNDRNDLESTRTNILKSSTGKQYEVMTWKEMIPELDQFFQAKMVQNVIMSGILYLVIAFGIFGTILMMLNERMHEFGILIAIGMKKKLLAGTVVLEMILLSIAGTLFGICGAYPLVYYLWLHPIRMGGSWGKVAERFNMEPVLRPSLDLSHFLLQGYIVLIMSTLLSIYAIYRIYRIKAMEAINS
ncbi:MAG TPA: FtsX-like permease family protein [Bacteroidia bacterium]|jgi:putative ABC transport system permease protein|nr:FtsX-like permease family protein [Bacteroidia bacterium]